MVVDLTNEEKHPRIPCAESPSRFHPLLLESIQEGCRRVQPLNLDIDRICVPIDLPIELVANNGFTNVPFLVCQGYCPGQAVVVGHGTQCDHQEDAHEDVASPPHACLTNRLLSVVRPRMADKTSWTKPPSLHRYGDSRLTAPPSEEGGYGDACCDHRKVAVSRRARKAGAAYRRREMRARARRCRRGAQHSGAEASGLSWRRDGAFRRCPRPARAAWARAPGPGSR